MNIIEIHAASFATRIGHVAAAEIAGLLLGNPELPAESLDNWFDPTRPNPMEPETYAAEENARAEILDKLGEYVCKHQVEAGERLYRFATGQRVVVAIGEWAFLSFEQRQPWETFTSTCRQAFNDLKAAQLAIIDARRAAAVQAPAGLKREDSIFEEVEDTFALRPEAVEALKLTAIYQRGQDAEKLRLADEAWDRMRAEAEAYNAEWDKFGGDPAKFDHDGDGKAGGSKPRGRRKGKGQPLSVGEAPVRPPVNRGGRGNRKPD